MAVSRSGLETRVIITPEQVKPTQKDLKVIGVLNPAAAMYDNHPVLLARVIEAFQGNQPYNEYWDKVNAEPNPDKKKLISKPKYVFLPRAYQSNKPAMVNWERKALGSEVFPNDRYSVKVPGNVETNRLTVISHGRRVDVSMDESLNNTTINVSEKQGIFPHEEYEEYGVEDPRITIMKEPVNIDGKKYKFITSYAAVSGACGVAPALAGSNDLIEFERIPHGDKGIIMPPPNKDVFPFDRKIKHQITGHKEYFSFIRPGRGYGFIPPTMFIMCSPDMIHWGRPNPIELVRPDEKLSRNRHHVGGGAPPIYTDEGWLEIYHTVLRDENKKSSYVVDALLLDLENPFKLLKKTREPILRHFDTGTQDVISNVAFATGAIPWNKKDNTKMLDVYLGVNDAVTAVTRAPLQFWLDSMEPF